MKAKIKKDLVSTLGEQLKGASKEWWNDNIPVLTKNFPDFSVMDLQNWQKMANWHGVIVEADEHLETEGYVITYSNGTEGTSQWFGIKDKAQKQFNTFLIEYGLTPNAKAKLERKQIKNEQDSIDNQDKLLLGLVKK